MAAREYARAPCGWIEEVIEARAYAALKAQYDRAEKKTDLPASPLLDLLMLIDFELAQEEIEARDAQD